MSAVRFDGQDRGSRARRSLRNAEVARFALDSLLEGSGFELSVPRGDGASVSGSPKGHQCASASCLGGDAG